MDMNQRQPPDQLAQTGRDHQGQPGLQKALAQIELTQPMTFECYLRTQWVFGRMERSELRLAEIPARVTYKNLFEFWNEQLVKWITIVAISLLGGRRWKVILTSSPSF